MTSAALSNTYVVVSKMGVVSGTGLPGTRSPPRTRSVMRDMGFRLRLRASTSDFWLPSSDRSTADPLSARADDRLDELVVRILVSAAHQLGEILPPVGSIVESA